MDGSSGVSPLGPSNKVKSAVRKSIKKINECSDTELKRLQRFFNAKLGIPSENLFFAHSLSELVALITDAFHPQRVLIAGPALNIYENAARSSGAEVLYFHAFEAEGFAFDMSSIHKKAYEGDLVFLANPNRITGKLIDPEQIRKTVANLPPEGPHLVIDESLIEFAGLVNYYDNMMLTSNITILRTTAFFYGLPGLEFAYAVSAPEVIRLYALKKSQSCINVLSAAAARNAYTDTAYRKTILQHVLSERKLLLRALKKIPWIQVYDTDTNIILIKADKNIDEIIQTVNKARIAIKDCRDIEGLDRAFFRISIMKHEYNLKFISVLSGLHPNEKT